MGAADCIAGYIPWNGTITTTRTIGGGGLSNLCNLWGALPRVSRRDFFLVPGLLNIFLEIKEFKGPRALALGAERRSCKELDSKVTPGRVLLTDFSCIYFPARVAPGGRVKSARTAARDRVGGAHRFPRNSKNFFSMRRGCGRDEELKKPGSQSLDGILQHLPPMACIATSITVFVSVLLKCSSIRRMTRLWNRRRMAGLG